MNKIQKISLVTLSEMDARAIALIKMWADKCAWLYDLKDSEGDSLGVYYFELYEVSFASMVGRMSEWDDYERLRDHFFSKYDFGGRFALIDIDL